MSLLGYMSILFFHFQRLTWVITLLIYLHKCLSSCICLRLTMAQTLGWVLGEAVDRPRLVPVITESTL